ncbi:MAG: TetR/AcrR family transcriptional regulator [Firmicutes bacterium]|nr:TetR/AcrR family transcriptional regulator [Bacillota bacterium]
MKKQPEVTEATRKRIVEVFCQVYLEKPLEKITVKELSEKAGLSRVTFYNYFRDTYDLLDYIEEEFISSLADRILENIQQGKLLENFIGTFLTVMQENELYGRVLLNNPHNLQFGERLKRKIIPLVMSSFGMPEEDVKAEYVFEFYIPGVISMISRWLRSQDDMPAEKLGELVKGILQDGVLKQLGREDAI